jgi:excisionase family DNA binding protein
MKLTVREAAKLLNTSEKSVYRWIKQGLLPAYRINDQYRINRAELLEWATSRKSVPPAIFEEPEGGRRCCRSGGVARRGYPLPGRARQAWFCMRRRP